MTDDLHTLDISPEERWPVRAADVMAAAIQASIDRNERCLVALSGGGSPKPALAELASRDLPWNRVTLLQVDDRIVPADSPERNLTWQMELFDGSGAAWLPLPVDELLEADSKADLEAKRAIAIDEFCIDLVELAGDPPVLDLVHLGLGSDGHTASLVPGDPLVDELRDYVGVTGDYQGTTRISLTRPVLDRSRMAVWLVAGASKAESLGRLLAGDMSIPAGLIRPAHSVVLADSAAARQA